VPLSSYGLVESNVFCANGDYQLVLHDSQLTHLKGNWLKSHCAGSNCWGQQLCNAPKAVSCMDYKEATPFKPSIGLLGNRFTQMSNNYWPPGDCAIDSGSYQCINDQAVVPQGGPSSGEPTASNREVVINKALDAVPYHSEDDDNDGVSNLLEAIYFGTDPTSAADLPDNYNSATFVAADWDICSANPANAKVFRVSPAGSDQNPCTPLAPCATLYKGMSMLADNTGDILHMEAGDYAEEENIHIEERSGFSVVGDKNADGTPAVTVHRNIGSNVEWVVHDAVRGIYRSKEPVPQPGSVAKKAQLDHAWGFFRTAATKPWHKLVPYPCLAAMSSDREYAVKGYTKIDWDPDGPLTDGAPCRYMYFPGNNKDQCIQNCPNPYCETYGDKCPFIGPGVFYDRGGTEHVYIRMVHTQQMSELGVVLQNANPADRIAAGNLRLSVGGMWLATIGVNDITIANIRIQNGHISLSNTTQNFTLENVAVEGIAWQTALEVGQNNQNITLDKMYLTEFLPAWLGYVDAKKFYESLMTRAIRFGAVDSSQITLKNSVIARFHDGVEMASSFAHHVYVHDNLFEDIGDDAFQLGSKNHNIHIHHNRMLKVFTGISRHGNGESAEIGTKYIHHNVIDTSHKIFRQRKVCDEDGENCYFSDKLLATNEDALINKISDGKNTSFPFGGHALGNMGISGDPRHIYNNTVVYRGVLNIGYSGQSEIIGINNDDEKVPCPDGAFCYVGSDETVYLYHLPLGNPAIVANNMFIHHNKEEGANSFISAAYPNWLTIMDPAMILDGNAYYTSSDSKDLFALPGVESCDFTAFATDLCGTGWHESAGWTLEQNGLELAQYPLAANYAPLPEQCSTLNAGTPLNLGTLQTPTPNSAFWVDTDTGQWNLAFAELPGFDEIPYRGAIFCEP
jgi:hypothetical protein